MPATQARKRDFLSMADLEPTALLELLEAAARLKAAPRGDRLAGMTLALVFEKPSLRTRLSFDVAMAQQGGRAVYFAPAEVGLGTREPARDVARVLSRMVDAVALRTHEDEKLVEFAQFASVPVINALSAGEHPCQCLADLLTIRERKGRLAGVRLAYIGDGNNVANSLLIGGATAGMEVVLACPEGYAPPARVLAIADERARQSGGTVRVVHDPAAAAEGADVLYTDVWTSMGQEAEAAVRRAAFAGFTLDRRLLALAAPDAIVMHDLPAHRGEEIEDEVLEGPQSVVFDQAENRLHAQKALLIELLGRA
ncbi:MAG: ornithine carbamoyltransferase [Chloroflexota bacterium]|nr:ornithine carbamoyltransferase [Dehalococcoidia bacterium]MDW8254340.1 ornithine carbamoyltransferase [Chloroflexota bacterium]